MHEWPEDYAVWARPSDLQLDGVSTPFAGHLHTPERWAEVYATLD